MHRLRALLTLLALSWLVVGEARASERRGAVVIARTASLVGAAATLARASYREPSLRPRIDEATARAVLGVAPPPEASAHLLELARVARVAAAEPDPAVASRLLRSLGDELEASLLVVVDETAEGPTARAFLVAEGRYLSYSLAPRRPVNPPAEKARSALEFDWSDAISSLVGVTRQPSSPSPAAASSPAPRVPPSRSREPTKPPTHLVSSPWFWGSLAAVVSVGVTVLILSQTTLDAPSTLRLDGRIAP